MLYKVYSHSLPLLITLITLYCWPFHAPTTEEVHKHTHTHSHARMHSHTLINMCVCICIEYL